MELSSPMCNHEASPLSLEQEQSDCHDDMKQQSADVRALSSYRSPRFPGKLLLYSIGILLICTAVTSLLHSYHRRLTAPIGPGDSFSVGDRRSRCGLLAILPSKLTNCSDFILHHDDAGNICLFLAGSIWNKQNQALWRLYPIGEINRHRGAGMEIAADGTVTIGGLEVALEVVGNIPPALYPWPFARPPKVAYKKVSL